MFLKLGLMSFGGPVAHIGYIRAECVERRRFLTDEEYADLVALCQFLPGPASSQVVFAIGMLRAGLLGALAASLGFLSLSAALMIGFAYGVTALGDLRRAGFLHGLKLAAVAVVAQAVWSMGKRLCPDRPRVTLCLLAAGVSLALPGAYTQIGVIAGGAVTGYFLLRGLATPPPPAAPERARGHVAAVAALAGFAGMFALPGLLSAALGDRTVAVFDAFYRAGALVFGGGHVVLPLLREAIVPRGWMTDDAFLAGYGAAQAVPGPLFSFAGYLGTVIQGRWTGGLYALAAIFLPGYLLVSGALPFWRQLRSKAWMAAALAGANAAVVGVLLGALYTPVFTGGVRSARDAAAALAAFGLLEVWKAPPWVVVALCAGAGQWVLG